MSTIYDKQIQNRNFLSPIGFKFTLTRFPKVNLFCNYAKLPEISLGTAIQSSYLKDIDVPGDKLSYGDFSLRFLIDEDMENFMEIYTWMKALGYPESTEDFSKLNLLGEDVRVMPELVAEENQFSDGVLHILNSNYNSVAKVSFKDLFPVFLSSLDFEASNDAQNYLTAEVTFKYTIYDIVTT